MGIYVAAPFLGRLLNHLATREILVLAGIILFFNYLLPCMEIGQVQVADGGQGITISPWFSSQMIMISSGIPAGLLLYPIAGYLIMHRNIVPDTARTACAAAAVLVFSALVATGADFLKGTHVFFLHWYSSSVTIAAGGIALAILLRCLLRNATALPAAVSFVSKYSFGMYLTHYTIIFAILLPWWQQQPAAQHPALSALFYFAFCAPLSRLLTWLLAQNRFTRYLVA